ncbi:MAG TPA: hypothetical protein PLB12_10840 [Candidatus Goldiibacteriota bacterium]|nr:hypothetical protein [Candidatus Goldiibacteriota bacterium]
MIKIVTDPGVIYIDSSNWSNTNNRNFFIEKLKNFLDSLEKNIEFVRVDFLEDFFYQDRQPYLVEKWYFKEKIQSQIIKIMGKLRYVQQESINNIEDLVLNKDFYNDDKIFSKFESKIAKELMLYYWLTEMNEKNNRDKVSVINEYSIESILRKIKERENKVPKESKIKPEEKEIQLGNQHHHGTDELENLAKSIVRCPYVEEVMCSLEYSRGTSFIRNSGAEYGYYFIDLRVVTSDEGYGLRIKTTAENDYQNKFVMELLNDKFNRYK